MPVTSSPFGPYTPATPPLTETERRVAQLVGERKWTTKRIAAHLGISVRRVQVLITSIAMKTGVEPGEDDRVHVAVWWRARQQHPAAD